MVPLGGADRPWVLSNRAVLAGSLSRPAAHRWSLLEGKWGCACRVNQQVYRPNLYRLIRSYAERSMDKPKPKPGETLERVFRDNPDLPILPFLACVEQKFRRIGDIEMLREIRAYRLRHNL